MTVETAPLGEVATIERATVQPDFIPDGETYVGLENITTEGSFSEVGRVAAGELKSGKFRFDDGHLLYGKLRPYLSKIAAPSFSGVCSTDILPLRAGPRVDRKYLLHFLRTPEMVGHASKLATGANLPRLSPIALAAFSIPLPPIGEQRRIAAVLDAADALRAKRRQAIAKLDSLTQAIFIDMFGDPVSNPMGWPIETLGALIGSATYGTSRKAGASGEYPVLRMGNLTTAGQLDISDMKYVDLAEQERSKHLVHAGDVLFNRTNSADLVGKTAVYRATEPMAYAGYLVRLRPNDRASCEYLGAFMNLPSTKQTLRAMCKSIVGMANINAQEVQRIQLPVPSMDLQNLFAHSRNSVASRRTAVERQIGEIDTLFASLQQRAFRGEL